MIRSVIITGASSGIGAALARLYAKPGRSLALTGRDGPRLEAVAADCRALGAEVESQLIDVADRGPMTAWITERDAVVPTDLVIANAGISGGTGGSAGGETEEQTRRLFATNLGGVHNTVLPLIEPMRRRGRGQIALMASLAAYRGFASAPAYCATKAAVKVWGEGLRPWLAEDGVKVSVICPGFVESRITDANSFPMPLLMPADKAARIIARGLERNRPRIAFPWPMVALVQLTALLPPALLEPLMRRLPKKG
ncbi:MAG: SDR family NAD(P)-dependent oxidoreductase [Rhodospirillales bacterium]